MRATRRRAAYPRGASPDQGLGSLLASRWAISTALALLAVAFVFVDSMLTVEVQRISLETYHLDKEMKMVTTELDALDSNWASMSSHVELDERAAKLGFIVPSPDQVILLPVSFLEQRPSGAPAVSDELCHEFMKNWAKLVLVGTP